MGLLLAEIGRPNRRRMGARFALHVMHSVRVMHVMHAMHAHHRAAARVPHHSTIGHGMAPAHHPITRHPIVHLHM